MELVIQHTWDGTEIPSHDFVFINAEIQKDHFYFTIRSPFYHNLPPSGPSGSLWRLWEFEVVEVFLVGENGEYTELEFGPYGHYLVLKLNKPRNITQKHLPIDYTAKINQDRWTATASVPMAHLPKSIHKINCFAIHNTQNSRRYLSLSKLPGEQPDFHQPTFFPLMEDLC